MDVALRHGLKNVAHALRVFMSGVLPPTSSVTVPAVIIHEIRTFSRADFLLEQKIWTYHCNTVKDNSSILVI